jgi:tetratricopeptide (TPR) repeat protein
VPRRFTFLLIIALASPVLAGDWTRWPVDQLVGLALERSCELANDERGDFSTLGNVMAYEHPRDPDALAVAAALLAENAARADRSRDLEEARTRLAEAEKIEPSRPLCAFARGAVALAEARHAAHVDERRGFLARADEEFARVATATGALRFYARAARMTVAFERRDADLLHLRASEALVAAREVGIPLDVEHRVRANYERRLADLDAARLVLREARFLERARWPRGRRGNRGWTDFDDVQRSYQRRWETWALLTLGASEDAIARAKSQAPDGWSSRAQATALLDLGDPARALVAARRARNLDPGHASQEVLAQVLLALGRNGEARGALEAALRTADGASCSHCLALLARVLVFEGKDSDGERLAARAERADDGSVEVLKTRALAAARRGDRAEANALGTLAWSAEGRDEARSLTREEEAAGRALEFGRFEEAEEHAARVLAARPGSQRALRLLALATARHGDPRAPFLVERLDDPQDAWVLLQRGVARARNPATLEAAETDLGRAVALYGNTPSAPELVEARRALAGVRQQLRHSR